MNSARGNTRLRLVDRYVGIPLLAALGGARKHAIPTPATIRRVGFLKTAAIGDTLLLAGLAEDFKQKYPAAAAVLIAGPDNSAAADLLCGFDERVTVSPSRPLEALRAVRAAKVDLLLDFGSWPRFDATLTALSGARYRVGFHTAGQYRHFALDQWVRHSPAVHERMNYVRLMEAIGVECSRPAHIPPPCTLEASRFPAGPYAVLHGGAGGYLHERKEWPIDRWAAVGSRLVERGFRIVLSGAPREREWTARLADLLRGGGCDVSDTAGTFSIVELADVLARSEVVISVNTGVMHLSALVGARTVGLHGPTSVVRWGPVGPRAIAVASPLTGCGFLNLGFEYANHRADCMAGLTVAAVLTAADTVLAL